MPVVRHKTVRKKSHLDARKSFVKRLLERLIVILATEDGRALGAAVHDVKHQAGC